MVSYLAIQLLVTNTNLIPPSTDSGVSEVFTVVFFKALSKVNCSKYVGGHVFDVGRIDHGIIENQ